MNIYFPIYIDLLAFLIGWLAGDGAISKSQVGSIPQSARRPEPVMILNIMCTPYFDIVTTCQYLIIIQKLFSKSSFHFSLLNFAIDTVSPVRQLFRGCAWPKRNWYCIR